MIVIRSFSGHSCGGSLVASIGCADASAARGATICVSSQAHLGPLRGGGTTL